MPTPHQTQTAGAAARHRSNLGEQPSLLDAEEYLDTEAIKAAGLAPVHCAGCRCPVSRPSGIRRVKVGGKVREFAGGFQI